MPFKLPTYLLLAALAVAAPIPAFAAQTQANFDRLFAKAAAYKAAG